MIEYRLANGVTFVEDRDRNGGIITVRYPRRIIRLSAGGARAIQELCGPGSGRTVADEKLKSFAAEMENKGILTRYFPKVSDGILPLVSIIVPTYGRPKMLKECVESLLALDYPKQKLEVIVVDDASPDPVVLDFSDQLVRIIRLEKNSGPGGARNEGVKHARGEIIAFLDDDCVADKGWLKHLVPCFQHPDIAAAGGRVESAVLTRPLDRYEQVQSPLLMGTHQRKVKKGSALSYLATCNLLVRKDSFLGVGGFNPTMRVGEDVDLCWRILEKGEQIYYIPEGLVFHHHRSELGPFLKRRFTYGQSEAKLQARYPNEIRKLPYFPGNPFVLGIAALVFLQAGVLPGLAAGVGLVAVNLLWQTIAKILQNRSSNYIPGFWQVFTAIVRSQGTAVYLFCQHFSRYYSIPSVLLTLMIFPRLVPFLLAIHLLPGIVDYKLKRPSLGAGYFFFYQFWENIFYQAGVFSGCLKEHNWRPLTMDLIRTDARLFETGCKKLNKKQKKGCASNGKIHFAGEHE